MPYGPSISEGPRGSGTAGGLSDSDRIIDENRETLRHPPGDAGEPQGKRRAPAFVRHHQTGAGFDSQPDEDNDDDHRDSEADGAQSDKNYVRLMHSIHDDVS